MTITGFLQLKLFVRFYSVLCCSNLISSYSLKICSKLCIYFVSITVVTHDVKKIKYALFFLFLKDIRYMIQYQTISSPLSSYRGEWQRGFGGCPAFSQYQSLTFRFGPEEQCIVLCSISVARHYLHGIEAWLRAACIWESCTSKMNKSQTSTEFRYLSDRNRTFSVLIFKPFSL